MVHSLAEAFRQSPAAGARANLALIEGVKRATAIGLGEAALTGQPDHIRRYAGILGALVVQATAAARRLIEAEERVARGEEP